MKKRKRPRLHTCAVCGKKRKAEAMIYSRFTNQRYCVPLCTPRGVRKTP